MLLFGILASQDRISPSTLFRDSNALMDMPFYSGALSNLGILFWWSAAVVCALTYVLFRKFATPDRSGDTGKYFFLYVSVLTALLALDDLLMIHEEVLPRYLGFPELTLYALYGVAVAVLLLRFWSFILRSNLLLLFLTLSFFGLSVLIDLGMLRFLFGVPGDLDSFLEDGAKLLGIASWLYYLVRFSLAQLSLRLEPRSQARMVASAPATEVYPKALRYADEVGPRRFEQPGAGYPYIISLSADRSSRKKAP